MAEQNVGKIVQVIGAVLDIKFSGGHMPALNNAIEIHNGDRKIVAEVSKHLGDDVVKCKVILFTFSQTFCIQR